MLDSFSLELLACQLRSLSCTLVLPSSNNRHHFFAFLSLIVRSPHTSTVRLWISAGCTFLAFKNLITYRTWYNIYLTAIWLPPGGSSTVHVYTQTIHGTIQSTHTIRRTTQSTQTIHRTIQLTNWEECGPCPVFAGLYPGICLTIEEKARKNLSQGTEECQLARWKENIQNR